MISVKIFNRETNELYATLTFFDTEDLRKYIDSRSATIITKIRHIIDNKGSVKKFFEKTYNPKFFLVRPNEIELLPLEKSEKRKLHSPKRSNKEIVFAKTLVRINKNLYKVFSKDGLQPKITRKNSTVENEEAFEIELSNKKQTHKFGILFDKVSWEYNIVRVETTSPFDVFKRFIKLLEKTTSPTKFYRRKHKVSFNENNTQ